MYCNLNTEATAGRTRPSVMYANMFPFRVEAMMHAAGQGARLPATDVLEDDSRYVIRMNMPGVSKERVTITAEQDTLTVRTTEEEKKGEDTLKTVYRERRSGTYEREFHFDEAVDLEHVTARMENGVLELTVPKNVQATAAKTIHID